MSLHRIALREGADLAGFRDAARRLVAQDVEPAGVVWTIGDAPDLFGSEAAATAPPLLLPRPVGELIAAIVPHRDPERYALLYGLIWRVLHGERALLEVASDPLVHRLHLMSRAVGRDLHKMHAFLRFRRVEGEEPERFVAWLSRSISFSKPPPRSSSSGSGP